MHDNLEIHILVTHWRFFKQAGAELGQAQLKLGLDFNSINPT